MKSVRFHDGALAILLGAVLFCGATIPATADPAQVTAIQRFLRDGYGTRHESAPEELEQFGRLVGLWNVEAEMRRQDGGWEKSAPGIWAWKYALDGFAVQDLWFQSADNLPAYMASLGRDYLLTSNRLFDVGARKWRVAWMANGAGKVMGADYGTFTAVVEDEDVVMTSPADAFGLQRVVFYEIQKDSFRWKSEYSQNEGKTWSTVMRLHARRQAR